MRILGVDPGLKATGYGFIDWDDPKINVIEVGVIQPRQHETMPQRLSKIHAMLDDMLQSYQPQTMVLEKLYAHYRHPTTASVLGHVRGVICLLCAQRHMKLVELSVKRVRKAITGNGNASKLQTKRAVGQLLRIDDNKLTLDASDALALALGFVRMQGSPTMSGGFLLELR